jgi:hypothetical protein
MPKTSHSVDLLSSVILFGLNTVRHVKCVRKMSCHGIWHVWGEKICRLGFVEKLKGQKTYRRGGYGRDHNIKMDLKEGVWEGLDRITVAQDKDKWWAFVNLVMNMQCP